ncbi:MAG: hypothetical protein O3C40_19895, partial [Planctomycetota bacterium]|nr:hypothetical protein [Planctomycetota bacterium]
KKRRATPMPLHIFRCDEKCRLGGAALGTLVLIANTSGDTMDGLYTTIDAERERNATLVEENLRLEKALEQAKLELKLERQNKFATNYQKEEQEEENSATKRISSPTSISEHGRRYAFSWMSAIGPHYTLRTLSTVQFYCWNRQGLLL